MSFHGVNQTYLAEKAIKVAVRWGIRYNVDKKEFVGPPYTCAAAKAELDKWRSAQERRKMLEERNHRW